MDQATTTTRIRGRILRPERARAGFSRLDDGVITIDAEGRITAIEAAAADDPLPITHPGAILLPGFVDAHVHYPQTRILGTASGPLLDWLSAQSEALLPDLERLLDDFRRQDAPWSPRQP